eukprot:1158177-Pelagomonas_calceolata.AAC.3
MGAAEWKQHEAWDFELETSINSAGVLIEPRTAAFSACTCCSAQHLMSLFKQPMTFQGTSKLMQIDHVPAHITQD